LQGLVYGLTPIPHEEGVRWYLRPVPLAMVVLALTVLLNLVFF
jgi:SSS family solute:Na+ symporter